MGVKKGQRYINFRTFLILFIVIVLAILCGYVAELNKTIGWLIFIAMLVVFAVVVLITFACTEKRFKIISIIVASFIFIISFFSFRITSENRISSELNERGIYTISGVVDDSYSRGDSLIFVLDNLTFNGVEVSGKLRASVEMPYENNTIYYIKIGDTMTVKAGVYFLNLVEDGSVNTYSYSYNIRYTCYPGAEDITYSAGNMSVMNRLRENIEDILIESMGAKYGSLAYAMLVGDKSNIKDETRDGFTVSGLSHILAVSGLHIAFICAILYKIFNKMRMNKIIIFVVTFSFLMFYMFLCDLSSPVIRSTIMYAVMLISKLFYKRYDPLSSLCFACCVILLIYPFYLFDAGFVLSAGAVYALILFTRTFNKFFLRLRLPKRLASAFSTITAVQLGILPAIFFFFSELQTYSILVNLILMPLISVTFTGIFVFTILSLVHPFFNIFLSFTGIGLSLIDTVAYAVSLLPYAVIIFPATGIIFLFYIASFFFSRFYMSKFKFSPIKIISFVLGCFLMISGIFVIEKPQLDNVIIPVSSYNKLTSIVKADNKTYIVGDFPNTYELSDFIRYKYIDRIDAILLNHLYEDEAEELSRLMLKIKIDTIYVPYDADLSGLNVFIDKKIDNLELVYKNESVCDGRFVGAYANGKTVGYIMMAEGIKIMFSRRINYSATDFQSMLDECAVVRSFTYSIEYTEKFYSYELLLDEDSAYSFNTNFIFNFITGDYHKKKF